MIDYTSSLWVCTAVLVLFLLNWFHMEFIQNWKILNLKATCFVKHIAFLLLNAFHKKGTYLAAVLYRAK